MFLRPSFFPEYRILTERALRNKGNPLLGDYCNTFQATCTHAVWFGLVWFGLMSNSGILRPSSRGSITASSPVTSSLSIYDRLKYTAAGHCTHSDISPKCLNPAFKVCVPEHIFQPIIDFDRLLTFCTCSHGHSKTPGFVPEMQNCLCAEDCNC